MPKRKLIAGNWKMNGLRGDLQELDALAADLKDNSHAERSDVMICPPATLITEAVTRCSDSKVAIGGQDCAPTEKGAHTGDISAEMLADAGASAVIVGHSERRTDHNESNGLVRAKAEAAHRAGLKAILCVGETEQEREEGLAYKVVSSQVLLSMPKSARPDNLVIAYEPVWAIGTGLTPTLDDIVQMHAHIEALLADMLDDDGDGALVLYGGSVKPANAKEILSLAGVDGALVGGASLKASDFLAIIEAASS